MVRDWELVRNILSSMEARETTLGDLVPESIEGYSPEVVSYHIYIMEEAGLIEAKCFKSSDAPIRCIAFSLTWDGHEFLDKIKNETIWAKVKNQIKTKGLDLSFEVIKIAATKVIENALS
ncbi:MAG: DUF2513 domain-containing protein [Sideroxyarcus sp.]|nr:DUF2513 domain-containing protein [Sideroxyarcus sp.]